MQIEVSAPSNIALIKYMGKTDGTLNRPTNSSLSWTLESLRTFVRITEDSSLNSDQWMPLKNTESFSGYENAQLASLDLSQKSQDRFLKHFQNLKSKFGIQNQFRIESANNFPADCGLASSASSFAALTLGALQAFENINSKVSDLSVIERAELSRQGSGSSCRSFFGPWAIWFSEGVKPVEFPFEALSHQVFVVTNDKKEVSSSEAHKRVMSSELFVGRPQRAEARLAQLVQALHEQNWAGAYDLTWAEFWDMHALFETSRPQFGYMNDKTMKVLNFCRDLWRDQKDGPLVTMDAGPNVHLLYRADQASLASKIKDHFNSEFKILES